MGKTGRKKCEILKGIRKRMAEANGIQYSPRECGYLGECSGTCAFCEKEASELLNMLKKKEEQGYEIIRDDISIELLDEVGHENSIDEMSRQKQEERQLTKEKCRPLRGDIPEIRKKFPCDDEPTCHPKTWEELENLLKAEELDERDDCSDGTQLGEGQENTPEKPHLLARLAQRLTDRYLHEPKGFIVTK